MQPKLTMTFDAGFGDTYTMVIPLDEHTAMEVKDIYPPMDYVLPFVDGAVQLQSFDTVIKIMKRREFRKDLFVREARRLGALLAERMEDAEGWHDASRIEPAKQQLREGQ